MEAATAGGGELRLIIATPEIGDGFPDANPEGGPPMASGLDDRLDHQAGRSADFS